MSAGDRRRVIEDIATEVFGERGYHGASIEEIARRSGVTVPVIYDHFSSKRALYQHLIEWHYEQLRGIWFAHAETDAPVSSWIGTAVDAWFAHIEERRFAGRMLFRDTTGDPELTAAHRAILDASRAEILPLLSRVLRPDLPGHDAIALELAWETFRSALQGLALWWYEHPDVPRQTIVAGAMNSTWIGFERFQSGDQWMP